MRAKEFILEDYNQQLESEINNLLIGAKGNGAPNISTPALVNQLQKMGYSIDVNNLMPLLQNNPAVANATPDSIELSSQEGETAGQAQDSASKVGDMAQKATKIG